MWSYWFVGDDFDWFVWLLVGCCFGGGDIDEYLFVIGCVL